MLLLFLRKGAVHPAVCGALLVVTSGCDQIPGFPDHGAISPRLIAAATVAAAYDELVERP